MSTIADLEGDVMFALGGRTDLQDRIRVWLRDAYIEIGSNYPFETLEESDQDLTVGGVDTYDYPATCRAIECLTLVMSQGQTIPLLKRSMRVLRRYPGPSTNMRGTPCIWAPFGRSFLLRPVPDTSYVIVEDFWVKPEIADPVEETELLVPDDWLEVITIAATIRGHLKLIERDKARELQMALHGDPRHPDENPGIIKTKLRRNQAEAGYDGWAITPKIRSYTR
jgi:hypothetical protein